MSSHRSFILASDSEEVSAVGTIGVTELAALDSRLGIPVDRMCMFPTVGHASHAHCYRRGSCWCAERAPTHIATTAATARPGLRKQRPAAAAAPRTGGARPCLFYLESNLIEFVQDVGRRRGGGSDGSSSPAAKLTTSAPGSGGRGGGARARADVPSRPPYLAAAAA